MTNETILRPLYLASLLHEKAGGSKSQVPGDGEEGHEGIEVIS